MQDRHGEVPLDDVAPCHTFGAPLPRDSYNAISLPAILDEPDLLWRGVDSHRFWALSRTSDYQGIVNQPSRQNKQATSHCHQSWLQPNGIRLITRLGTIGYHSPAVRMYAFPTHARVSRSVTAAIVVMTRGNDSIVYQSALALGSLKVFLKSVGQLEDLNHCGWRETT